MDNNNLENINYLSFTTADRVFNNRSEMMTEWK